jgi:hypothetical protein
MGPFVEPDEFSDQAYSGRPLGGNPRASITKVSMQAVDVTSILELEARPELVSFA